MRNFRNQRFIARLDIKGLSVIKGIRFDGLRVIGPVEQLSKKYYNSGADELLLLDSVASLYGHKSLLDSIRNATQGVFVPITAGGGIRTLEDARDFFSAGADRVALNSQALQSPGLLGEIAKIYGRQAVVLSIEAKRVAAGKWNCYFESGREDSGIEVKDWVTEAESFGVGEILITSVDHDGTLKGPDIELLEYLPTSGKVPFIYSGGLKSPAQIGDVMNRSLVSGVAVGAALHYDKMTINSSKESLCSMGLGVRV